jgi:hypothetical protein
MAGDGIAIIEMHVPRRIEVDCAASVQLQIQPPVFIDAPDCA